MAEGQFSDPRGDAYPELRIDPMANFDAEVRRCDANAKAVFKERIEDVLRKLYNVGLKAHALDQGPRMFTLVERGYDPSVAPQHQVTALRDCAQALAKFRQEVENREHELMVKGLVKRKQAG